MANNTQEQTTLNKISETFGQVSEAYLAALQQTYQQTQDFWNNNIVTQEKQLQDLAVPGTQYIIILTSKD